MQAFWDCCVYLINFAHKCAVATLLGYFSFTRTSKVQVVCLVVIQALMILYLSGVRPYSDAMLMGLEITCHVLELVLFSFACAMTFDQDMLESRLNSVQWGMIGERRVSTSQAKDTTLTHAFDVHRRVPRQRTASAPV